MRTLHVEPGQPEAVAAVHAELDRMLAEGRSVVVTLAEAGEWMTAADAAQRLGCTRQDLEWLIRVGEVEARLLGDPRCWQVSVSSVVDLEARRESAHRRVLAFEEVATQLRAS